MVILILADYYEEKGFANKSKRLRNHKPLIIYGWYNQYTYDLDEKYNYGNNKGNAYWFLYGKGHGYHFGSGWYYR